MASPAVPLHKFQADWLLDKSRFKIGMFARQTGKTFTTTLEIVDDCYEAESRGRRTRWVILSRGERQAKEAIDTAKMHAAAYGLAVQELESEFRVGDVAYRQLEIVFPGGSKITALPANPDTARGFSANVFLDEFAFHLDSRAIWKALFPVISAGWKLRVTSTPNGKNNKFFELMTAEDGIWSRHIVDIHRAVADGLPRDIAELRAGLADEDAWAQEYELRWLDEASAWLPYELISAVEHADAGKPELYEGGPAFLGNDIGRRKDLWVAWVWELVGDVLWSREVSILHRATFAAQDAELDRLFGRYRIVRACMDQTGMGEKPVEDAQRRHGTYRVEGVLFTGPNKLHLATIGKERFEDRTVRIPLGDPKLRADLHSLKKVTSETGAPRFLAEDDSGQSGSHGDRAWAAFLGLHAAGGGIVPIEHQIVRRRERADGFAEAAAPAASSLGAGGALRHLPGFIV
jgi:phage FluMu gp28-like protein